MKKQAFLNWSGGKDSALALYHTLKDPSVELRSLFTTLSGGHRRVSMHGVSDFLLEKQCRALGMSLEKLYLPEEPSMEVYTEAMRAALEGFQQRGITHSVFGDIFLQDLRTYREEQLRKSGMTAHFPLWGRDTRELVEEFVELGFKTIVVSVNEHLLDKDFCGRVIDRRFIQDLPTNVDPCGENGEFHTFVFDGPLFDAPVPFTVGDKVLKTYPSPTSGADEVGFWFCELCP